MKRTVMGILVVLMTASLIFTSCSTKTGNGSGTMTVSTVASEEVAAFGNFEKILEENDVEFTKTDLLEDAKATGAETGARYEFATGTVEVYLFDKAQNEFTEVSYERTITRANGEIIPVALIEEAAVYMNGFKDDRHVTEMMSYLSEQWYNF